MRRALLAALLLLPLPGFGQALPEMVAVPGAPYRIARTETSVAQWQACVAAGACKPRATRWSEPTMPMTEITAREAEAFAAWASGRLGSRCRLPTEEQWEWAARAGTATLFPWGAAMEPGKAVCHQCDPRFVHRPAPVGTMAANPYGLFDMNGNVWEWTADCAGTGCDRRVVKGGSWYFVAAQAGSRSRAIQPSGERSYDVGFRIVCD